MAVVNRKCWLKDPSQLQYKSHIDCSSVWSDKFVVMFKHEPKDKSLHLQGGTE